MGFFLFPLDLFERAGRECRPVLPLEVLPVAAVALPSSATGWLISRRACQSRLTAGLGERWLDRNGFQTHRCGLGPVPRACRRSLSKARRSSRTTAALLVSWRWSGGCFRLPKAVLPEQASPSPRSEVRRQQTEQLPSPCLVREEWDELLLLQWRYPPSSEKTPPVQSRTRLAEDSTGNGLQRCWPLALLTARHRHSDHRDAIGCGPSDHRGGNGPEALPERLRSLGRRLSH